MNEDPLIECAICGQGCHKQCWTELVQVHDANIAADITPTLFKSILNPLNIPNLYYICKPCEEMNIPKRKEKKRKAAGKAVTFSVDQVLVENAETANSSENTLVIPVEPANAEDQNATTGNTNQVMNDTPPNNNKNMPLDNEKDVNKVKTKVCTHFKKGSCKHGLKDSLYDMKTFISIAFFLYNKYFTISLIGFVY